jgi:hypothetical protein
MDEARGLLPGVLSLISTRRLLARTIVWIFAVIFYRGVGTSIKNGTGKKKLIYSRRSQAVTLTTPAERR